MGRKVRTAENEKSSRPVGALFSFDAAVRCPGEGETGVFSASTTRTRSSDQQGLAAQPQAEGTDAALGRTRSRTRSVGLGWDTHQGRFCEPNLG